MAGVLHLTGRFYRTVPMSSAGPAEEIIELDPGRTALLAIHCWNIGCPGGPSLDDAYWVGMGFPAAGREAYRVMRERILPAMEAARSAGVVVAHVESAAIGQKHPDLMEVPPSVTHARTEGEVPPPAVPGHRARVADRAHGSHYETQSPLASMDRASFLMPQPGEPFAVDSLQLHRTLSRRAVENLVYTGFATDMCLLHAPGGLVEMACSYGYRVFAIREATVGVEYVDWFEDRVSTRFGIRRVESHYGHSIGWDEWMAQCKALSEG